MNATAIAELAKLKQGPVRLGRRRLPRNRRTPTVESRAENRTGGEGRPGEDVLDVACGTGNVALRAAGGGRVDGVDLTPELFDTGRRLAAESSVASNGFRGTRKSFRSRARASTSCYPRSAACSPLAIDHR